MTAADWGYTVEHEFLTGRSATLRRRLPTLHLIEQGLLTEEVMPLLEKVAGGKLESWADATRMMRVICEGMFVQPRIAVPARGEDGEILDGEWRVAPEQDADGNWLVVPYEALADEEVVETFELVAEALAASRRFREERAGADGGGDSQGVGDDPVGAARPAARDDRPARDRRAAGKGAAGKGSGKATRKPARRDRAGDDDGAGGASGG